MIVTMIVIRRYRPFTNYYELVVIITRAVLLTEASAHDISQFSKDFMRATINNGCLYCGGTRFVTNTCLLNTQYGSCSNKNAYKIQYACVNTFELSSSSKLNQAS